MWYNRRMDTKLSNRFFSKIDKTPSGCWEWNASKNHSGYGQFRYDGKVMLAHRASYIIFSGDIPEGNHILHSCDNPACVNPEHLRPGTDADNVADKMSRNRHAAQSRTHCKNGHEYDAYGNNQRKCNTCLYAAHKRWKKKVVK